MDSGLNGRYSRALFNAGKPFPINFTLGAALMVRHKAIEAAGLLDEGYFMYAEEVDWCWRIRRAGWPFYCVPAARVIHHGGASAASSGSSPSSICGAAGSGSTTASTGRGVVGWPSKSCAWVCG